LAWFTKWFALGASWVLEPLDNVDLRI
jgi:hypothetical protein